MERQYSAPAGSNFGAPSKIRKTQYGHGRYVYRAAVSQPGKKVLATIFAAWARVTLASGRK